jgi:flagellar hook-basal body complex protein FliE
MTIDGINNGLSSFNAVKFKHLKGKIENKKTSEGFGEMLDKAWNKVNNDQLHSAEMTEKLVTGQVENIHDVMIAAEKAKISMEFTMEIRNKIMSAYKEIMRMQI